MLLLSYTKRQQVVTKKKFQVNITGNHSTTHNCLEVPLKLKMGTHVSCDKVTSKPDGTSIFIQSKFFFFLSVQYLGLLTAHKKVRKFPKALVDLSQDGHIAQEPNYKKKQNRKHISSAKHTVITLM